MKTIEVKLYQFSELSKEAQQKALSILHNINTDLDWWSTTYEDAKTIGLTLTSFGLERGETIEGTFSEDENEVVSKVLENHGEECQTVTIAVHFKAHYENLVEEFSDGIDKDKVAEGKEEDFDERADVLEKEFLNDMLKEYLSLLGKEYEFLSSEGAVKETIISNEYFFTSEGKLFAGVQ